MKKAFILASAAVSALLAGLAQAQTQTVAYTGTFSGTTDVTNQLIAVSQFNSSLGTLKSASFTLDATVSTSAFANNSSNRYVGWDKTTSSLSPTGDTSFSSIAVGASAVPTRILDTGSVGDSFHPQDRRPHRGGYQCDIH